MSNTNNGSIGNINSQKAVNLSHNFNSLSDREGYSSPFEPRLLVLCQFDIGEIEEMIIAVVSLLYGGI